MYIMKGSVFFGVGARWYTPPGPATAGVGGGSPAQVRPERIASIMSPVICWLATGACHTQSSYPQRR